MLPSRDTKSIGKRARKLGLKRDNSWKDWENKILDQKYSGQRGVAQKIHEQWLPHRTVSAIRAQAARLGLVDNRPWTFEEDQILVGSYETCHRDKLERLVPGRTKIAVVARALKLGLSRSRDWTDSEIEILREYYDPSNVSLVAKLIPSRTHRMIVQKAGKLGLSNKRIPWESWEDNIIHENYEIIGGLNIHNDFLPHRSVLSIRQRANSFGLSTKWSEEETEVVRQHYHKSTWDRLLSLLPFRTKAAIQQKAIQIGVANPSAEAWEEWEVEILRAQYGNLRSSQVQRLLPHRTTQAIIAKSFQLGLCQPSDTIRWTKEEKLILRQNYGKMTYAEMHILLPKRAPRSICAMAISMGIVKPSDRDLRPWSIQEDEILTRYYQDYGKSYVISLLKNRTSSSILSRANKLGLKHRPKRLF